METETLKKAETPPSSLWAGGLLAVSLVIFQSYLPLKDLDTAELISVFTLALAMPILAYKILINMVRVRKYNARIQSQHQTIAHVRTPYPEVILFIVGVFLALVGLGAAFLHIHWVAAVLFSGCTLALLLITYFFYVRK